MCGTGPAAPGRLAFTVAQVPRAGDQFTVRRRGQRAEPEVHANVAFARRQRCCGDLHHERGVIPAVRLPDHGDTGRDRRQRPGPANLQVPYLRHIQPVPVQGEPVAGEPDRLPVILAWAPTWPRDCPRPRPPPGSATPRHRWPRRCGTSAPGRGSSSSPAGPGPKTAPGKDAARPRIIELRAAGHSIDEIAQALAAEGTPLNRTGIAEVIAAEGLPRMWRRPDAERGGPAREIQARAEAADFAALPGRAETRLAGLFLAIPDLIALGVPDMVAAAGYPSTAKIPALSYMLSLLALKLTSHPAGLPRLRHRRRPRRRLFAGLMALPKATALTTYSYRLELPGRPRSWPRWTRPPRGRAGRGRGAEPGLPRRHALGRGPGPGEARRAAPLPAHLLGADLLRRRRRHPHPAYANADLSKASQNREVIAFADHWKAVTGSRPGAADLRLQAHHPGRPRRAR